MLPRGRALVSRERSECVAFLTEGMGRYERPAGLLITAYVYIVYVIALRFEGYVFYLYPRTFCTDRTQTLHGHDLLIPRVREPEERGEQEGALNQLHVPS